MATVVIDVERVRTLHCGLGQFCLHLGREILAAADAQIEPVLLLRTRQRSRFPGPEVRTLAASPWRREPIRRLVRPWSGPFPRPHFDLWHSTHQDSSYQPLQRAVPLVLTIHDLNFLREKPPATIRRRLKRLQAKVDRAAAVSTVSKYAAREISAHVDLHGREITVIANGICVDSARVVKRRPRFLPAGPFLFTIGDITAKKNFHTLVELALHLPEYRLVIAGNASTDYAARLRRTVADLRLGHRVILPGIVSDAERTWLYQNCTAFLFPSLSEGFGLPVVEAMSCGRPVFSSTATSLPEVGGSLAFYWDRFEPEAMVRVFRAGIDIVTNDPDYGSKLRAYAAQFTWQRAAQQYLALYQRVLAAHAPRRAA